MLYGRVGLEMFIRGGFFFSPLFLLLVYDDDEDDDDLKCFCYLCAGPAGWAEPEVVLGWLRGLLPFLAHLPNGTSPRASLFITSSLADRPPCAVRRRYRVLSS